MEKPGKNGNNEILINPGNKKTGKKQIGDNGEYTIYVSVRQLVEFILRCGDIDNRHTSGSDTAMQEGTRLHRLIQRRQGEKYHAEVPLKYTYTTGRYNIIIDGRADGIIEDEKVTIDEIKCVLKDLDYIKEPNPIHLAQALCYAYIYLKQHSLSDISVRMSYCHIETEQMKYFDFDFSADEVIKWFDNLMSKYIIWADFQYDWHFTSIKSIDGLEFPFPYREGQRDLVVYGYQTIRESKKIYIQAPTGVGKTITTVFPSVKAVGQGMANKIFYLTAKTITRTVAEDTYEILRRGGLKFKTVTITAKEKICPCEKTECNPGKCERAKGHYDRVNKALYELITGYDRIDRSVIEEIAEKYMVCPFELSLDATLFADSIICDYNYVFDPHVQLKRYFSEGMSGDYIFLIDEAHNLVDRGRDMFSAKLYKEDFLEVKRVLNDAIQKQAVTKVFKKPSLAMRLIKALERCNKTLLTLKKECDGCRELNDIDIFAGLVSSLHTVMDQFLQDEDDSEIRQKVLEFYFEICHFLLIYEKLDKNYTIYSEIEEDTRDKRFMVKLLCVNPRENLKEAMSKGRSSILFSATFLPIQYYKNLLGGEKTDYEVYAKSAFDNKKRGLFIAGDVTSKYTRRSDAEFHKIAAYIYEITKVKPGNYMAFFPSHAFLAKVYEQFAGSFMDEDTTDCIVQEEYMNEEMRENFLAYFSGKEPDPESGISGPVRTRRGEPIKRTLIGFCVLGGIFSEGIDLKNDSLIGAIVVGTGLPMVCNERELLKDFFDDENSDGFDYAYRYPGMNKVLQAAGRVIRTAEDVGIVALLDERFLYNQNNRLFPREWEDIRVINAGNVSDEIRGFWDGHS